MPSGNAVFLIIHRIELQARSVNVQENGNVVSMGTSVRIIGSNKCQQETFYFQNHIVSLRVCNTSLGINF